MDHNYYLTDEQESARYYNTGIGRFTQEDVIYNDGLNLYAYCSSNPVMYEDPSGYQSNKNQGNLNPCEITKSAAENSKTEIKAGKKYSKYKTNGQEFLNDIGEIIDDGLVKYVGKGTLKKGQPIVNIYRRKGMDLGIVMIN